MYNDTIDASNKIITSEDLFEIFEKINGEMIRLQRIANEEKVRNAGLESSQQKWGYKYYRNDFKCTFNFYDSTTITVDNYDAFINLYNTRLAEIRDMWVRCHIYYTNTMNNGFETIANSIQLNIYNQKLEITSNLSSIDDTLDDAYELIKTKILNAPERYDEIIKKKNIIISKIGFAIGMIPAMILFTLLAIIPFIRGLYYSTYILYPIMTLISAFLAGNTLFTGRISSLYSIIEPTKKYVGWDSSNSKGVYKDDIGDFTKRSEILIGKNINNLKIRGEINELNEKYSKIIPIELIVLLVLSLIMILIGKFII